MGLMDREYMHEPPPPSRRAAVGVAPVPAPRKQPKTRQGFDGRSWVVPVLLCVLLTVALAGVTRIQPSNLEIAGLAVVSLILSRIILQR